MADDLIEIKSLIRKVNGHTIEARYIGGKLVSVAPAPFVLMDNFDPWPWESMRFRILQSMSHPDPRSVIMWNDPKAKYAWWDGSCICTDLVKEGPKEMVLYGRR